jgi:polyribonucleotide nucleotidyltransferase
MNTHRITIGDRTISFETGRLAKQADGAVVIRLGDTMVLATACAAARPREGIDFLPLTVDYRESTYASGRIPGGFFKREGRPTEKEILTCRLIDRPLRPLFPDGWRHETQIIAIVISADTDHDSDVLAITGASAALALSSIPLTRTVAAVRVGHVDGEFVINPTFQQRRQSVLDLVVAGTNDGIVMVEAGARGVPEAVIVAALARAHEAIKILVDAIDTLAREAGKPSRTVSKQEADADLARDIETRVLGSLAEAMRLTDKLEQARQVAAVQADLLDGIPESETSRRAAAKTVFKFLTEKVLRDEILLRGRRLDGRAFDEIRPITIEVGTLPRTHGSAVFTRGETQALVTVTLGTESDQQRVEAVDGEAWKRFMLHYNFPPFSVGEVAFLRGPGRREIGHGALAERALQATLPTEDQFPYTVRIVSDILEANGSSSMASVCGGTLAMMDAGVPLAAPVAGVAMGLIVDEASGRYAILTDIAGAEDHYGDMDFKITGTAHGVTALQMDIKVSGITTEIMTRALEQARVGRLFILDRMYSALAASRPEVAAHAPRIVTIRIAVERIRDVIGPGGKMIRSIVERSGAKIDVADDGRINIASTNDASAQMAISLIQQLTATPELHKSYLGTVQRITDFGAFVEIMPGLDGLLHVSEVAHHRVRDVRDELKEGDQVMVQVINVDPSGKVRLSRKALLSPPAEAAAGGEERKG